jgi:hypothetical protein
MDFLSRLVQRAEGTVAVLQPHVPSRYEPLRDEPPIPHVAADLEGEEAGEEPGRPHATSRRSRRVLSRETDATPTQMTDEGAHDTREQGAQPEYVAHAQSLTRLDSRGGPARRLSAADEPAAVQASLQADAVSGGGEPSADSSATVIASTSMPTARVRSTSVESRTDDSSTPARVVPARAAVAPSASMPPSSDITRAASTSRALPARDRSAEPEQHRVVRVRAVAVDEYDVRGGALSRLEAPREVLKSASDIREGRTPQSIGRDDRRDRPRSPAVRELGRSQDGPREPSMTPQPDAPVIHVTIGRIDVRAVSTPAPLPPRTTQRTPRLSLDEYLRSREEGPRD